MKINMAPNATLASELATLIGSSRNGHATIDYVAGNRKSERIFEPVEIGIDYIRFHADKPDQGYWPVLVPFSSIVAVSMN
jgi:hypothetical protein